MISFATFEGMCKPDYGKQIFSHSPKGVYFIVIIKKPCLPNGNRRITKMGVAHAFEQFGSRFFLYSSTVEFMHNFLEKFVMLIMKTEKHPVAMQICIAQFATAQNTK